LEALELPLPLLLLLLAPGVSFLADASKLALASTLRMGFFFVDFGFVESAFAEDDEIDRGVGGIVILFDNVRRIAKLVEAGVDSSDDLRLLFPSSLFAFCFADFVFFGMFLAVNNCLL